MKLTLFIYDGQQYNNSFDADKEGALTPLPQVESLECLDVVIAGILATAEMFASDSYIHCFALLDDGSRHECKLRNLLDVIENN